jgi:hypothetical protein
MDNMLKGNRVSTTDHRTSKLRLAIPRSRRSGSDQRPVAAFRQRWHAPRATHAPGRVKFVVEQPGAGYVHAVTRDEVSARLAELPRHLTRGLQVVQLSGITRKRQLFPCYGMQWGSAVYLYPIEESLTESYHRPPTQEQLVEARMFGGRWTQEGSLWTLTWSADTVRDFYLNNVLIHEIGHLNDQRNTNTRDRERYANWFAIEYGYRASRRGVVPRTPK